MDFNHTVTLVYSPQSLSQPLGHVSRIPADSRKVVEREVRPKAGHIMGAVEPREIGEIPT